MSLEKYFKAVADGDMSVVVSYKTDPRIKAAVDEKSLAIFNEHIHPAKFLFLNCTIEESAAVLACYRGTVKMVKYFYHRKINLFANHNRCLRRACFGHKYKIAKFLIHLGADVYDCNSEAFLEAEQSNARKILKLLNSIDEKNVSMIRPFIKSSPTVSLQQYLRTLSDNFGLVFGGMRSLDILADLNDSDWNVSMECSYPPQPAQVLVHMERHPRKIQKRDWLVNVIEADPEFGSKYPQIMIAYQKQVIEELKEKLA